jgi:hypothetical protein
MIRVSAGQFLLVSGSQPDEIDVLSAGTVTVVSGGYVSGAVTQGTLNVGAGGTAITNPTPLAITSGGLI